MRRFTGDIELCGDRGKSVKVPSWVARRLGERVVSSNRVYEEHIIRCGMMNPPEWYEFDHGGDIDKVDGVQYIPDETCVYDDPYQTTEGTQRIMDALFGLMVDETVKSPGNLRETLHLLLDSPQVPRLSVDMKTAVYKSIQMYRAGSNGIVNGKPIRKKPVIPMIKGVMESLIANYADHFPLAYWFREITKKNIFNIESELCSLAKAGVNNPLVVEVGPGDGEIVMSAIERTIEKCSEEFIPDIVMIDKNPLVIDYLNSAVQERGMGSRTRLIQGDGHVEETFEDVEPADIINERGVSMYLTDKELEDSARFLMSRLKPGGLLIVDAMNEHDLLHVFDSVTGGDNRMIEDVLKWFGYTNMHLRGEPKMIEIIERTGLSRKNVSIHRASGFTQYLLRKLE